MASTNRFSADRARDASSAARWAASRSWDTQHTTAHHGTVKASGGQCDCWTRAQWA
jgi:hypothetical protein